MIHCSESQAGESSRTLSFFIFINVCSLGSNSERDNCWNEEAEVSEIQVTADGVIDATMVEGDRHWVPEMDATPQVFLYYTDTKILEQLTSDYGSKEEAFMWKAPEYNDEYGLLCNDRSN